MQQKVTGQAQTRDKRFQRGPFPWLRVIIMLSIALLLLLLSVAQWTASSNPFSWTTVAPLVIALIVAIIPFAQWLFPLSPISESTNSPGVSASAELSLPIQSQPEMPLLDIFHFDETQLPNPGEFYGREYERRTLITRTSKSSSTAIIGDYRLGKSWLMQYLLQSAPTHPQLGQNVRVARLSATHPQSQTPAGLVKRALEVLNAPERKAKVNETPLERLAIAVRELRALGIVPVLCIDEFAGIIGRPGFDKDFIMGLRAIIEDDKLVLVTASRQSLHEVIEHMTGETSPLFNIMQEIALKPFTEAEANIFISEKGQQAGFNQEERAFFMERAALRRSDGQQGWPPLRLQLVGQLLLDDKQQGATKQRRYAPKDPAYQADFKTRLDEQYKAVVKHL